MRTIALKKTKVLLVLVGMVTVYSVSTVAPAAAANVTIDLCAEAGVINVPGGGSVDVWGFVLKSVDPACSGSVTSLPGPVLEVNLDDDVTVTITQGITGHTATFEAPGMNVSNPSTDTYTFTADRVGTFGYQSTGDAGRQMAMGLAGALVVRPGTEAAAFGSENCSGTAGSVYGSGFDGECLLVLGAIDPAFNADPDGFNMHEYDATYWLINEAAYPDTDTLPAPGGARRLLLRYVNAGFDNTAISLVGVHEQVLAKDAYPLSTPLGTATEILPAGGTEDAIVTVPSFGAPTTNGFPLFNRNLHVTNGSGLTYQPLGGMLTFITP